MKSLLIWTTALAGGPLALIGLTRGAVATATAAGISPYTLVYAVPVALAVGVFFALTVISLAAARPARVPVAAAARRPAVSRSALTRLLLAAVLFASFGSAFAASPAEAADCAAYHTVQAGETLYRIGLKYNMVWTKIAAANNIANADKIYAGQVLCIPASSSSGSGQTNVQNIIALQDLNIRSGPGISYAIVGWLAKGKTAKVTGISADKAWWRVVCPDGTSGECYVSAGTQYTQPVNQSGNPAKPVPTITITSVSKDESVTISATNFPANTKFDVRMGKIGTQAVNGWIVTTTNSGTGTFTATYAIPPSLRGQTQIAIRLESASGYFSFNWFWNT